MVAVLRSVSGLLPALLSAGLCLDRGVVARRRGRGGSAIAWYAAGPVLAYAAGVAPLAVAAAAVLVVGGWRLYGFAVAEDDDLAGPPDGSGRPPDATDLGREADERPDP